MRMPINPSRLVQVLAVSLGLSLVQPLNAVAGTITFNDLTDAVTFTDTTGRVTASRCTGESCTVTLQGPVSARLTGWDSGFNIFEPGSQGQIISDTLQITPFTVNNITFFDITFTSDTEGIPLLPLSGVNGVDENGLVQFGGGISWGDPGTPQTFDTIQFQSDVETIPEPSTILLMLMGFAGLTGIQICRRVGQRLEFTA